MRRFFLLLIVIVSLSGQVHASEDLIIQRLVVFGDSLSDQGKLYQKLSRAFPASPPYWKGRFSNGPIWADVLAEKYPLINEAEGGASSVDYKQWSSKFKYKATNTLENEINQFLDKSAFQPDDLVIIWIGGNDYLNYHRICPEDVERVILELVIQMRRLERLGVKHILAVNLPDMGQSPGVNRTDKAHVMTDVTGYHNLRMQVVLEQAFNFSIVKIFDAASIFNDFVKSPQRYDFLNTTDACYTGDYFGIPWSQSSRTSDLSPDQQRSTVQRFEIVPDLNDRHQIRFWIPTPKCAGYVYMDRIHPSQNAHLLSAKELDRFIQLHYSR